MMVVTRQPFGTLLSFSVDGRWQYRRDGNKIRNIQIMTPWGWPGKTTAVFFPKNSQWAPVRLRVQGKMSGL